MSMNIQSVYDHAANRVGAGKAKWDRIAASYRRRNPQVGQNNTGGQGMTASQYSHPNPVGANRMANFSEAARALEAHAMQRQAEIVASRDKKNGAK